MALKFNFYSSRTGNCLGCGCLAAIVFVIASLIAYHADTSNSTKVDTPTKAALGRIGEQVNSLSRGLQEHYQDCDFKVGQTFGSPLKVASIGGNTKGCFGADSDPTRQQFFAGIKDLLPADFKVKNVYHRDNDGFGPLQEDYFILQSKSLTNSPDLSQKWEWYDGTTNPNKEIILHITYNIDNPNKVGVFDLYLGSAKSEDLSTFRKVKNKWLK